MITYNRSAFALNLLVRVHGSAIYRAIVPGLVSSFVFAMIRFYLHEGDLSGGGGDNLGHPYAIGVVVTGATFTIVFRASQGYSRYWEACSAIYQMSSKFMDTTAHSAVYHMQCARYDHIKPPSFNDYPELTGVFFTRDRERVSHLEKVDTDGFLNESARARPNESSHRSSDGDLNTRSLQRSINVVDDKRMKEMNKRSISESSRVVSMLSPGEGVKFDQNDSPLPTPLLGPGRNDGNWGALTNDGKATFFDKDQPPDALPDKMGFASTNGGHTPALFLQELAHLASLLNAVALSTLRNDVDGAESPLDCYEPGAPWPEVDPLKCPHVNSRSCADPMIFLFDFLGFGRTPEQRTLYNAQRPLPVIGGVSDSEINFLQKARGPGAKTQLCWYWLSEYIMREHLAGSLGTVGAPILSRVMQFISDGMIYYNHARKISFVPFPFVHAQLSAMFVIVIILAVPFLMDQYTTDVWLGLLLTFFAVTCLSGIHEVARELENPFRNVPNELPVVTLQAQFNETLLTMYAGYHPDHYWNTPENLAFARSINEAKRQNGRQKDGSSTDSTASESDSFVKLPKRDSKSCTQRPSTKNSSPTIGGPIPEATSCEPEKEAESVTLEQPASSSPEDLSVDQLRMAVSQQGKMMERMMEEQIRLNKLLGAALEKKTS